MKVNCLGKWEDGRATERSRVGREKGNGRGARCGGGRLGSFIEQLPAWRHRFGTWHFATWTRPNGVSAGFSPLRRPGFPSQTLFARFKYLWNSILSSPSPDSYQKQYILWWMKLSIILKLTKPGGIEGETCDAGNAIEPVVLVTKWSGSRVEWTRARGLRESGGSRI